MEAQPLAGRTVAVPETRELEVFATLLERRGAQVLRCPWSPSVTHPTPPRYSNLRPSSPPGNSMT